ncbi:MAG: hypothetical protein PHS73_00115 [Candidatus Peribacteraceae bacterium]|nr:hypothetical protein [Candidatus Peribacteraceae bacterium]
MRLRTLPLLFIALLLTACFGSTPPEPIEDDLPPASSSSSESIAETHNVVYAGKIQPAGVSIFMEGTHRLILPDGRFILLQSETVDLNGYVGEEAEVTGAVRPTVEQGGTIMRVEQIRLLTSSSASSAADSSLATSAVSSNAASSTWSSAASSTSAPPSSAASSRAVMPPSSQSSSAASAASVASVDLTARIALMAKQDLAESNWTRAYCTSHIGFCIPVHRNWWFKSFGASSPSLWHLEVSAEEIEREGDGPLAVDLRSGSASAAGASDGEVRTEGDSVTGYKDWTENRYFAIRAPAALAGAVEYMLQHLTPMDQQ